MAFGGADGGGNIHNDTWEYDGTTWTPGAAPPPGLTNRYAPWMTYDSVRSRMVLFGGDDFSVYLDETWEHDGAGWALGPAAPPGLAGRTDHRMAFHEVAQSSWALILSKEHQDCSKYLWDPVSIASAPHPYGRLQVLSNTIVHPSYEKHALSPDHSVAAYLITLWLAITLGLALGYVVSYFISQQTMIYYILRKKVDGIEMNEVFEEAEEEPKPAEAGKPAEPPKPADAAAPPAAPAGESKPPEPPKEEKK